MTLRPLDMEVFGPACRARNDAGAWLFWGANPRPRRGGGVAVRTLAGRPEHVDDVGHHGTWHVQLSGTKVWQLRPRVEASEWGGDPPWPAAGGGGGFRVCMRAGDALLLNTRIWSCDHFIVLWLHRARLPWAARLISRRPGTTRR